MPVMEKTPRADLPAEPRNADERLLASLGYKQEFKREFTPLEVFGIAFSIIGLLPSLGSVLGYAIPNGGPAAMVWGWASCSLFILFVGMAMAELASAAPTSGGLYFWTYSLSSPKWRNLLCWIVGYANTVGTISSVASVDWGLAVEVMAAASIGSGGSFTPTGAQKFGLYALVVISHAVICCLGTAVLARLQNVYITLNVLLCLAVIVALPAATASNLKNTASFALGDFTNMEGWSDGYAFFLSWLAPAWTIGGYDSCVHISEEAANASTAVPWGIVTAIFIAGVLGWAINVSMAFCMGTDLTAINGNAIGQPMATIFNNSFGQQGTLAVWAVVIVVQYMMGTSILLASSRQVFAFSRDGALPLSSWLYRMNKFTKTPVNTVFFSAFWAIMLGLLSFAGPAAIGAVFSLAVVASYTAYSVPMVARFVFKNSYKPGPFNLGRWGLPVAIIAVAYMLFMNIVFLFPTTPQTDAPDMNYTVVLMGGVLLLSLVYYYFPKYGAYAWFRGPISNTDQINTDRASSVSSESDRDVTKPDVEKLGGGRQQ